MYESFIQFCIIKFLLYTKKKLFHLELNVLESISETVKKIIGGMGSSLKIIYKNLEKK